MVPVDFLVPRKVLGKQFYRIDLLSVQAAVFSFTLFSLTLFSFTLFSFTLFSFTFYFVLFCFVLFCFCFFCVYFSVRLSGTKKRIDFLSV